MIQYAQPVTEEIDYISDLEEQKIVFDPHYVDTDSWSLTYTDGLQDYQVATSTSFVVITGREKTRKSLLRDCMVSSLYTTNVDFSMGFKLTLPPKETILHIDTEQTKSVGQENINRFTSMCSYQYHIPNYEYYHIRKYGFTQQLNAIKYLCEKYPKISLLIIDQVADLCNDVNNSPQVTEIIDTLKVINGKHQCMIMAVLHTNRTGENTNGVLGSRLDKLTDCTLICELKRDDSTRVIHKHARKQRIPEFSFTQDANGYPNKII